MSTIVSCESCDAERTDPVVGIQFEFENRLRDSGVEAASIRRDCEAWGCAGSSPCKKGKPRFRGVFPFSALHRRVPSYSAGYVNVTSSHFDVLLPS